MENTVYLKADEFDLQKFKIEKDSMKVEFNEIRKTNEGTIKIPHSMEPPYQAHPDLLDLLSRMKEFVLKQYDYHKLNLSKNKESKAAWQEINKALTVTGFTLIGSDNLKGAIVTAKIKTESGTRALPTGRIVFSSDKLGYEKECEVLIEELQSEVYSCLFENKRAQLDLFQEEKKDKKEAKLGLVS